jgi:DNA polymerase elongation subunit (family B)
MSAPYLDPDRDPLLFQIIDIQTQDCVVLSEDSESGSGSWTSDAPPRKDPLSNKQFQILLFGADAYGRSVCLQVEDYRPYFFVRIPTGLGTRAVDSLQEFLLEAIAEDLHSSVSLTVESHKTLWDYNGGAKASFLRVEVPSQTVWRTLRDTLLTKSFTSKIHAVKTLFGPKAVLAEDDSVAFLSKDGKRVGLKVYEANIDPVLRFFHERDISPAAWIQVNAGDWEWVEGSSVRAKHVAMSNWKAVQPRPDKNAMAPLLVASWDIECSSSHGDFPMARKTWRKPVREMAEAKERCPETVEAMCVALAAAMNAEEGLLSRVYMKKPLKGVSAQTVLHLLNAKHLVPRVQRALNAMRMATTGKEREVHILALDELLTLALPPLEGDEIIQIGTVLYRQGAPVSKHIWVLGSVDSVAVKPPGAEVPILVYSFSSELALLKSWFKWAGEVDPDVLIGYNVFGFDEQFVWDRLLELCCTGGDEKKDIRMRVNPIVGPWGRLKNRPPALKESFLSSSAMGDNTMYILGSIGRLQIDLLPYIRKAYALDSYSLDNTSATFVSGAVLGPLKPVEGKPDWYTIATKSTKGTVAGRFITLMDGENDRVVDRCEVVAVEPKALTVHIPEWEAVLADHGLAPERWAQVKDNVSPKDIFRLHKGSAKDRAIVAKYCLQDCDLVMELFQKLDILNNSVAMANVCSVPVSFIFLRGQGIKIESLIFKECRKVDQLIEVMPCQPREAEVEKQVYDSEDESDEEAEDSYEGAIVLEPHTGIYIDDPVTADDFASLYPSSIISENISHDTLIWVKDYDNDGRFVCLREGSDKYDNLPGAKYVNIEFDILRVNPAEAHKKHPGKIRDGKRVARYIQDSQGTIPRILEMLLASRKRCRKLAETEPDEFARNLLDAQQLAYKLTANALYGQLGSGTFKVRRQVLAASTTAYGRKQLMFAKAVIEEVYGGGRDPRCDVECVYGDTDSIFLRFRPRDPLTGERLRGHAGLKAAKDLTIESGKLVSSCLKPPHDFEFDKIFRSFILLSKKRYVGDMSEDGIEEGDFHRKSMGIVMKRRDNAPIVKYVYGHVIDYILDTNSKSVKDSVQKAAGFVEQASRDLLAGKFPLTKLTITKSLRANYADPNRIAHKVLADRIAERDPGNKPSTTDRIPYVHVVVANPEKKLGGEKIELPTYIKEHGLKPDYAHYITNQISKPVAQVFGLALDSLPRVKPSEIKACEKAKKPVEAKEKLANKALFEHVLLEAKRDPATMRARGQVSMATFMRGKN